jgi:hypothetical protein
LSVGLVRHRAGTSQARAQCFRRASRRIASLEEHEIALAVWRKLASQYNRISM